MSISDSHLAYVDCYTHYNQALEDPVGIRIRVENEAAAIFLRMRMHQARKIDRRRNAETYERGHPMHNVSPFDGLTVRIRPHDNGDGYWVVLEKTPMLAGEVESLSGQALIEHEPQKMLEAPRPTVTIEEFAEIADPPKVQRRV